MFFMRIKIFLLQLLIIVVLSSCGNKDSRDFNKLQTIDISDGFKKSKKIFLSEIATDINYIFLETKGEFLIRNADLIFFTDKNVFVLDESTPQILKFDLKGKFIQKIGNVGHGLGEFEDIFTATLCKEDETLTIYDGKQYKFIQYKYDGSLIKES